MKNRIHKSLLGSIGCLIFLMLNVACQQDIVEKKMMIYPEMEEIFKDCKVDGSIVIYDRSRAEWIVSDTVGIYESFLPASTFKILNLLIALETGVIDDEEEVIHYRGQPDTLRYGYRPGTYRDMTVSEAFEASAVWVFLDLAEKIGKENYRHYLRKTGYGNEHVGEGDLDFWNFGQLRISPMDQVRLMMDLYEHKLPFSKRNMDIAKKVMLSEIGRDYSVHGKTGWTREEGINIGWWVGYVEKGEDVYFFATRLLQDRKYNRSDFGSCRKKVTEQVFEELRLLYR